MAHYTFTTHWRMCASADEVWDVLSDVESLTDWWSAVYLDVDVLRRGNPDGVGKTVLLLTRGKLPYTLRWQMTVVGSNRPHNLSVEATGDLVGRGVWTFEQRSRDLDITYDWSVRADKPLLRYLSFLLRPIFSANHRWAMQRGREGLERELVRRRALQESRT